MKTNKVNKINEVINNIAGGMFLLGMFTKQKHQMYIDYRKQYTLTEYHDIVGSNWRLRDIPDLGIAQGIKKVKLDSIFCNYQYMIIANDKRNNCCWLWITDPSLLNVVPDQTTKGNIMKLPYLSRKKLFDKRVFSYINKYITK